MNNPNRPQKKSDKHRKKTPSTGQARPSSRKTKRRPPTPRTSSRRMAMPDESGRPKRKKPSGPRRRPNSAKISRRDFVAPKIESDVANIKLSSSGFDLQKTLDDFTARGIEADAEKISDLFVKVTNPGGTIKGLEEVVVRRLISFGGFNALFDAEIDPERMPQQRWQEIQYNSRTQKKLESNPHLSYDDALKNAESDVSQEDITGFFSRIETEEDIWDSFHYNEKTGRPKVVVRVSGLNSSHSKIDRERRSRILTGIEHPNIMKRLFYREIEGHVVVVEEQFVNPTNIYSRPLEQRVEILMGAAKGLQVGHRRGIIHRDIKPENIMAEERIIGYKISRKGEELDVLKKEFKHNEEKFVYLGGDQIKLRYDKEKNLLSAVLQEVIVGQDLGSRFHIKYGSMAFGIEKEEAKHLKKNEELKKVFADNIEMYVSYDKSTNTFSARLDGDHVPVSPKAKLEIKLIDWGLMLEVDEEGKGKNEAEVIDLMKTEDYSIIGTYFYMAPEQITGERGCHTRQSDIFQLGAALYRLVTGKFAYSLPRKGHLLDRLSKIKKGDILRQDPEYVKALENLSDEKRTILRHVKSVIAGCLQYDPAQRYQSVPEVIEDLQSALGGTTPQNVRKYSGRNLETYERAVFTLEDEHPGQSKITELGPKYERTAREEIAGSCVKKAALGCGLGALATAGVGAFLAINPGGYAAKIAENIPFLYNIQQASEELLKGLMGG